MLAVKGIYDGKTAKPLEPVNAPVNAPVIIAFLEDSRKSGRRKRSSLDKVAGSLQYSGPAKTLADMERAIAKGVAEKWQK